jgi:hypothetical protein
MIRLWSFTGAALALVLGAGSAQAQWGTIKGQVVFDGKPPAQVEAKVDKDQQHCLSKGKIYTDAYVVDPKTKGVRWVVVWLQDPKNPKAALKTHPTLKNPPAKVEIDQPCCKFEPRVLAMREGSQLVVKNSAPIPHNTNIIGGNLGPNVNPIIPAKSEFVVKQKIFARPRAISYSCSIHGWMKGWIWVFNHPYFAVTDANGNFEIKNAPTGKYRLVVWQESTGWVVGEKGKEPTKDGVAITVPNGKTLELGKIKLQEAKD